MSDFPRSDEKEDASGRPLIHYVSEKSHSGPVGIIGLVVVLATMLADKNLNPPQKRSPEVSSLIQDVASETDNSRQALLRACQGVKPNEEPHEAWRALIQETLQKVFSHKTEGDLKMAKLSSVGQ